MRPSGTRMTREMLMNSSPDGTHLGFGVQPDLKSSLPRCPSTALFPPTLTRQPRLPSPSTIYHLQSSRYSLGILTNTHRHSFLRFRTTYSRLHSSPSTSISSRQSNNSPPKGPTPSEKNHLLKIRTQVCGCQFSPSVNPPTLERKKPPGVHPLRAGGDTTSQQEPPQSPRTSSLNTHCARFSFIHCSSVHAVSSHET
jgi:hypothetical protein